MPELPGGHMDRIKMTVIDNASAEVSEVEKGQLDWIQNPPPPDRYAEIRRRYEGTQFRSEPVISNFYFWMNTQQPPFDDVRIRRAVNYALEPGALERIYAGSLRRLQQILPPGMPGFSKFQPYPHDLTKARELVAEADPSDRRITVWTDSIPPADEAGEYYGRVLESLGFEVDLKIVSPSTYFTVIGNANTPDLDTGWSNWLLEYPNPYALFAPQLTATASPRSTTRTTPGSPTRRSTARSPSSGANSSARGRWTNTRRSTAGSWRWRPGPRSGP